MEITEFFLKFALVLVSAKAMAEVFARLGLPGVIGEVLAGLAIGPSLLGVIGQEPTFMLLANIGVLFLLFHVGLETDVGKLVAVGGQALLVAGTGVALPFVAGTWAAMQFFGMEPVPALFVGGTLVATSIGITLRVLKDLGRNQGAVAQVVLGAAVIDDVIGVVALAMLIDFSTSGTVSLAPSLKLMGLIALILLVAPALGPLFRRLLTGLAGLSRVPGTTSAVIVAFMLALSAFTHEFGAPEIIGAFAAGLALTGSPTFLGKGAKVRPATYTKGIQEIDKSVTPVGEIFMPFFFVMVGVSMDLRVIDFSSGSFWAFSGILIALAFITKLASGVWVKGPVSRKLATGVAMVPRGEVGLVFAKTGLAAGIFDQPVYSSLVFVVALTTLFSPLLLKLLLGKKEY